MVRLTYNNYAGPTLLQSITTTGRQYPHAKGGIERESRGNFKNIARGAPAEMKRDKSVEIDAEPLSSEEEEEEQKTPDTTPKTTRIQTGFNDIDQDILAKQEQLTATEEAAKPVKGKSVGSRRSKRGKVADSPPKNSLLHDRDEQEKVIDIVSDEDAIMTSWEKERVRKKRKTQFKRYHGSATLNIHASAPNLPRKDAFHPVPASPSPRRSERYASSGFQDPGDLRSPTVARGKGVDFFVPTEHDLPGRRKTRPKLKDDERVFKVPDDPGIFRLPLDSTASSATTADQPPTIFSLLESSPRARSGSASSLSSINSIASLLLTQDEKESLMKNDADSGSPDTNLLTAQCPLCSTPVSNAQLEEFTIRHSSKNQTRLPSRLQQKFCRDHRATTARETWDERGYPTIDWDALATVRVTRHLLAMRNILHQHTASFYRDKLVEAKRAGPGRRNLLKYHQEGVLEVAKYGYYGPRGGKVAAEALMQRLSRELAAAAERDPLVREVAAVGFVQAVLVPELVGRWVAEDRGLRLEGEGWKEEVRGLLEESSEVGGLVNEDEDRVVLRGGEGEGDGERDGGYGGFGRGDEYVMVIDEV